MQVQNRCVILLCGCLLCCWSYSAEGINYQLSIGRKNLAATSVLDIAIFAGGEDSTCSSRADIFNFTTGERSTYNITARARLAGTSLKNLAFFVGGDCGGTFSNVIDIFNASSGEWSTYASPVARNRLAATSVLDLAIFAGGRTQEYTAVYYVEMYNSTSRTWFQSSPGLSIARVDLAATSSGNLAFFGGGYGFDYSNVVDAYNASSNKWTVPGALSVGRSLLAATAIGNLVIFAGGFRGNSIFSNVVDIYNIGSNEWTSTTLSIARASLAATTIGNFAVFGGGNDATTTLAAVDVYDTNANIWFHRRLSIARTAIAATTAGGLVLFGGGVSSNSSVQVTIDTVNNCNSSSDCDDGLFCTDDECISGFCIYSHHCQGTSVCTTTCNEEGKSCFANSTTPCENNGTFTCDGFGKCLDASTTGSSTTDAKKGSSKTILIAAIVPSLLVALGIASTILLLYLHRRRNSRFIDSSIEMAPKSTLTDLKIDYRIGGGNFGDVLKGTWHGSTPVALKTLKDASQMVAFEKETRLLQSLKHPNIVQYLGLYTDETTGQRYIVTEYLSEGGLDAVITTQQKNLTVLDLLSIAKQAASGMTFLEQQNIVHRDLALRNLLASKSGTNEKYIIKISDFGLSRVATEGYYKSQDIELPIKWTSPEAIEFHTFSSKSDVWSFGVLLWELFSFGKVPYATMSNKKALEQVKCGYRLPVPEFCPPDVYNLMMDCWNENPDSRPTFKTIRTRLEELWKSEPTLHFTSANNGQSLDTAIPIVVYDSVSTYHY